MIHAFLRFGTAGLASAILIVSIASAQDGLTQRDSQGPVSVVVTLISPPVPGAPLKARVSLDTHSVALDAIALDRAVTLRTPDGAEVAATGLEQVKGGGHHREAVVVFPPVDATEVRIVVKDVGGIAERSFRWELAPKR